MNFKKKKNANRKVTTNKSEALGESAGTVDNAIVSDELPYELTLSQTENYFFDDPKLIKEMGDYKESVDTRNQYYANQGLYDVDLVKSAQDLAVELKADTALDDLAIRIKQLQEEHTLLSQLTADVSGKSSYDYLLKHKNHVKNTTAFWKSIADQAKKYLLVKVNDFNQSSNVMQIVPDKSGKEFAIRDKGQLLVLNNNFMGTLLGLRDYGSSLSIGDPLAPWYRKTIGMLYAMGEPDYAQQLRDIMVPVSDRELYQVSLQEFRQLTDLDLMTKSERADFDNRMAGKVHDKGTSADTFKWAYDNKVADLKYNIFQVNYRMSTVDNILMSNSQGMTFNQQVTEDLKNFGSLVTALTNTSIDFDDLIKEQDMDVIASEPAISDNIESVTNTPDELPDNLDYSRVSAGQGLVLSTEKDENQEVVDNTKVVDKAELVDKAEVSEEPKVAVAEDVKDASVDTEVTVKDDNKADLDAGKSDTIRVITNESSAYVEDDSKEPTESELKPSSVVQGVPSFTLDDLKQLNDDSDKEND